MLIEPDAKEIKLRDYQADAVQALRDRIKDGQKRIILCAGTGAGKTVIASHLMRRAQSKESYSLFIVDRVALVDQTSAVFDDYGIRHGVLQGIHQRYAPREHIQVCSAQTLARRSLPRDPDLIVVDECHTRYAGTRKYIEQYPDAVKIGLTATPFTKGLGNEWDCVVNVIPTRALIDSGFLIEPKIYVAKSPNDEELGTNSFGEFTDSSASEAGIKIIGDVVSEWMGKTYKYFGGPAKTIVFSPTVEHGRELCDAFRAAGYNFQQISYLDRNDEERREKIREFRRPDSLIDGLVSCGVLTKGFDVPEVRIGISCKPYKKSLSSHMQEIGRVMRSLPDGSEKKALWLCHSGNVERFAGDMFDIWDHGVGELDKAEQRDSVKRERSEVTREKAVCPECSGAMRGPICVSCGWERPARSDVNVVDGELHAFKVPKYNIQPRSNLRAECVSDPKAVWNAALYYCFEHSRKGEDAARKWAYGIWRGIYPNCKLPFGWFDAKLRETPAQDAYSLIDRETKRFRKKAKSK